LYLDGYAQLDQQRKRVCQGCRVVRGVLQELCVLKKTHEGAAEPMLGLIVHKGHKADAQA
jgi:hypothetical protein